MPPLLKLSSSVVWWRNPGHLLPLLVVFLGIVAFHNCFSAPFIFDDLPSIVNNPYIRQLWPPWEPLKTPPDVTIRGRPIAAFTLAVNYAIGGLELWGYHAVNLAVHLLSGLALYGIVRRTLLTARFGGRYAGSAGGLALAVALVWTVHPLQTESVTYVIQRTGLLMGLFYLTTLYCVIRGFDSPHRNRWFAAAVISCLVGMGCKEVMATAPVVVLLYDRVFLSGSFHAALSRHRGLYMGLTATWLFLAVVVLVEPNLGAAGFGFEQLTPLDYARTEFGVILYYVRLAFWPRPLVLDYYDWPIARQWLPILPSAAAVAALVGLTLWALRRRPALGFAGAWFFLILAPSSTFFPLLGEAVAERRMYLPLAALVALVVVGGHALLARMLAVTFPGGSKAAHLVGAVLVGATVGILSWVTIDRNEDYQSVVSIWSDTVRKRPENARARLNLGRALVDRGRFEDAKEQYRTAIQLMPNPARAHDNMGNLLVRQGKLEAAFRHFAEALRLNPLSAEAHNNMGGALAQQGRLKEALAHFERAVRIDPNFAPAQLNRQRAIMELRRAGKIPGTGEGTLNSPGQPNR